MSISKKGGIVRYTLKIVPYIGFAGLSVCLLIVLVTDKLTDVYADRQSFWISDVMM